MEIRNYCAAFPATSYYWLLQWWKLHSSGEISPAFNWHYHTLSTFARRCTMLRKIAFEYTFYWCIYFGYIAILRQSKGPCNTGMWNTDSRDNYPFYWKLNSSRQMHLIIVNMQYLHTNNFAFSNLQMETVCSNCYLKLWVLVVTSLTLCCWGLRIQLQLSTRGCIRLFKIAPTRRSGSSQHHDHHQPRCMTTHPVAS